MIEREENNSDLNLSRLEGATQYFGVVGDKTVIKTLCYPFSHALMLEMVRYSLK